MKLAEWARIQGITYVTAYNWFRQGKLPVKAIQTTTGTILIDETTVKWDEDKPKVYCDKCRELITKQ